MRIVEFPYSGTGEPNWPAEGESAFSNAKSLGDKIVGEYSGADETLTDYAGNKYMGRQYRTHITEGELIELMGEGPYTKAFRGAFPQGAAPADDTSLFFFERTRRPARDDGLVDVLSAESTAAFEHFIDKGYMIDSDKIRIQQGIEE